MRWEPRAQAQRQRARQVVRAPWWWRCWCGLRPWLVVVLYLAAWAALVGWAVVLARMLVVLVRQG